MLAESGAMVEDTATYRLFAFSFEKASLRDSFVFELRRKTFYIRSMMLLNLKLTLYNLYQRIQQVIDRQNSWQKMLSKQPPKNVLPSQMTKKQALKDSDVQMYTNINLGLILQTISEMKHTLNPSFLLRYVLILRAKIAVCPENDWRLCFCCGCMMARRINGIFLQNQKLWLGIIQLSCCNTDVQLVFSDLSRLFQLNQQGKLAKMSEKERIELCKAQTSLFFYLRQPQDKDESSELTRFEPLFYLVGNITKVSQSNLQDHIILILEKIKNTSSAESIAKLKTHFQDLFQQNT